MKVRPFRQRIMQGCIALGMAIPFCLMPISSFAQQADSTVEREAQALLESAVELMQAKQFAPACRKLEMVLQKLPQATGARLELARCHRGEGRMASAWRQYVQVENLARMAGQKDRIAEATKNATELARIVGKLQLDVPPEVASIAGLTITLDGQVQEPSSWGIPVPLDAMEHEIVATAPGLETWTKRVRINDNVKGDADSAPVVVKIGNPAVPRTSLRIEVPLEVVRIPKVSIKLDGVGVDLSEWSDGSLIKPGSHELNVSAPGYEPWTNPILVQNGEQAVITIPKLEKTPSPSRPTDVATTPRKSNGFDGRVAGIVGIVTGGLTIGAGAILGGIAISRDRASDDGHCDANDFCFPKGVELRNSALKFADASTATFIVGGVLAAAGVIVIAASPSTQSANVDRKTGARRDHSALKVWLGPTSIGARYGW
jgi:hypothetical protein